MVLITSASYYYNLLRINFASYLIKLVEGDFHFGAYHLSIYILRIYVPRLAASLPPPCSTRNHYQRPLILADHNTLLPALDWAIRKYVLAHACHYLY